MSFATLCLPMTKRKANDRLLCVYRTGSNYHKSCSADEDAVFCVRIKAWPHRPK